MNGVSIAPSSNTGAKLTGVIKRPLVPELSIDWATVSINDYEQDDVFDALLELGFEYLETRGGVNHYKRGHIFTEGVRLNTEPNTENQPKMSLTVPGSACRRLGSLDTLTLVALGQPSRLDIALDHDYFLASDAGSWLRSGLVRTRARGKNYIEDLTGGHENTCNVGSRNSERMLRIYDQRHLEERKHLTRVELQLMGDMARGFWDKLSAAGFDGFIELALGAITDFVDFVDTTKDKNTTRAKRLEAWSLLVGSAARLSVRRVVAAVRTAETVAAWAVHSVSAILTASIEAGAITWDELQREGLSRYRPKHKAIARGLAVT